MIFGIGILLFIMNNTLLCMKEYEQRLITLKLLNHWPTHNNPVNDPIFTLSWDPSAKHLASTSNYKTLAIWDTENGKKLYSSEGYGNAVFSTKEYLLAGICNDDDEEIITLHNEDLCNGQNLPFDIRKPTNIVWHPFDEGTMAIAGYGRDDNNLLATHINIVTFYKKNLQIKPLKHFTIKNLRFCLGNMSWNSKGTQLAFIAGSPDAYLEIWDVEAQTQVSHFRLKECVSRVRWHPKKDLIFIGSSVLDSTTGKEAYSLPSIFAEPAEWSPNGEFLAVNSKENRLLLLEADTGTIIDDYESNVSSLAWSPDSKKLATTSNGIMSVWSVVEKKKKDI